MKQNYEMCSYNVYLCVFMKQNYEMRLCDVYLWVFMKQNYEMCLCSVYLCVFMKQNYEMCLCNVYLCVFMKQNYEMCLCNVYLSYTIKTNESNIFLKIKFFIPNFWNGINNSNGLIWAKRVLLKYFLGGIAVSTDYFSDKKFKRLIFIQILTTIF